MEDHPLRPSAAEAFELVRLRGGWGIRSCEYGEVCHPGVGPRREAEALYVTGLGLRSRWANHEGEFILWDVGLGGAANAVTVIDAAREHTGVVQIVSFDRSTDPLSFALRHAAALGYFGALEEPARQLVEREAITFRHGLAEIRWRRVLGDFTRLLTEQGASRWPQPHAILFDPHSPATNPEMWTLPVFARVADRLDTKEGCALATYSRSTAVRTALLLAGFFVGKGGGVESKEETTVAANRRHLILSPLDARWLRRAHASATAEPWTQPPYLRQPLRPETREALSRHPQFRDG